MGEDNILGFFKDDRAAPVFKVSCVDFKVDELSILKFIIFNRDIELISEVSDDCFIGDIID